MPNRYAGPCHACGKHVPRGDGEIEKIGRRWKLWCMDCYDASDNSSCEDRACGNRAYEDACARAVGDEIAPDEPGHFGTLGEWS